MKDYSKFKLQLNCLLFLFLNCISAANAQDLSLECSGQTEMASTIGSDKYIDKKSYDFQNGKFYGHISAEWSVNSITVNLPKQKGVNNIEFYERTIIFDRNLGSVFDYTKSWRTDIRKIGSEPNVVHTFKGDCRKSAKKF
jgi:hypothetical protein